MKIKLSVAVFFLALITTCGIGVAGSVGKVLTVKVSGGYVFDLPADRFKLSNYGVKDRRRLANIRMLVTDNFLVSRGNFEKKYCEGYPYKARDLSTRETILPKVNLTAKVSERRLLINGNRRTVTYVYIPDIEVLVVFFPFGQDADNKEVVDSWRQTFRGGVS